ncbi:hypothetical protein ACHAWF_017565 [Thalassiosira exigua]
MKGGSGRSPASSRASPPTRAFGTELCENNAPLPSPRQGTVHPCKSEPAPSPRGMLKPRTAGGTRSAQERKGRGGGRGSADATPSTPPDVRGEGGAEAEGDGVQLGGEEGSPLTAVDDARSSLDCGDVSAEVAGANLTPKATSSDGPGASSSPSASEFCTPAGSSVGIDAPKKFAPSPFAKTPSSSSAIRPSPPSTSRRIRADSPARQFTPDSMPLTAKVLAQVQLTDESPSTAAIKTEMPRTAAILSGLSEDARSTSTSSPSSATKRLLRTLEEAQEEEDEASRRRVALRERLAEEARARVERATREEARREMDAELSEVDEEMAPVVDEVFRLLAELKGRRDFLDDCLRRKEEVFRRYEGTLPEAEDATDAVRFVPHGGFAVNWEVPPVPEDWVCPVEGCRGDDADGRGAEPGADPDPSDDPGRPDPPEAGRGSGDGELRRTVNVHPLVATCLCSPGPHLASSRCLFHGSIAGKDTDVVARRLDAEVFDRTEVDTNADKSESLYHWRRDSMLHLSNIWP